MTAQQKAAKVSHTPTALNSTGTSNYIPDERAARFRHALPEAERQAANIPNQTALLNYAEALTNAARCGDCAFYERGLSECKAHPPRALVRAGVVATVWPAVHPDDWCAAWRRA